MLNYSTVSPPKQLKVNDTFYTINTDFRTWIKIDDILNQFDDNGSEDYCFEQLLKCIKLAFGEIINEPINDSISQILEFRQGYSAENTGGDEKSPPVFSFIHDINLIAVAFMSQYSIDISATGQELHWWRFLLLFSGLEDRHRISEIISYRAYQGKDKERLKLKKKFALPHKITDRAKEQRAELAKFFGG